VAGGIATKCNNSAWSGSLGVAVGYKIMNPRYNDCVVASSLPNGVLQCSLNPHVIVGKKFINTDPVSGADTYLFWVAERQPSGFYSVVATFEYTSLGSWQYPILVSGDGSRAIVPYNFSNTRADIHVFERDASGWTQWDGSIALGYSVPYPSRWYLSYYGDRVAWGGKAIFSLPGMSVLANYGPDEVYMSNAISRYQSGPVPVFEHVGCDPLNCGSVLQHRYVTYDVSRYNVTSSRSTAVTVDGIPETIQPINAAYYYGDYIAGGMEIWVHTPTGAGKPMGLVVFDWDIQTVKYTKRFPEPSAWADYPVITSVVKLPTGSYVVGIAPHSSPPVPTPVLYLSASSRYIDVPVRWPELSGRDVWGFSLPSSIAVGPGLQLALDTDGTLWVFAADMASDSTKVFRLNPPLYDTLIPWQ